MPRIRQIPPNSTRQIEIFSVGCPLCSQIRQLIEEVGSGFCDIVVLDVRDEKVALRARALGLRSFPGVAVDAEGDSS